MVIDVVTWARSMPANMVLEIGQASRPPTPALPTSPALSGSSESRPMRVGRSKAVLSPSPPARRISWNRALVSSAVPKPANIRMVHSFERYIEG